MTRKRIRSIYLLGSFLFMKSIEDQAEEYAEALNDIADIMELPTGNSAKDIVEAVHDMRARLSAYEICKAENARFRNWIREEGKRTDTCTYHILGREICPDCRCSRMPNDVLTKTRED